MYNISQLNIAAVGRTQDEQRKKGDKFVLWFLPFVMLFMIILCRNWMEYILARRASARTL